MTRVLVDLTRARGVPGVYEGGRYGFAVRGLMQIARQLALAGCTVTALADPEFAEYSAVREAQEAVPALALEIGEDERAVPAAAERLRADSCILWNGCHLPHVAAACRASGTQVVFAEAGWFDRTGTAFVDDCGVMVSSSLWRFAPPEAGCDPEQDARLEQIARRAERRRLLDGDYLLVLLDAGKGWTYFDRRHKDPLVLVSHLQARFPGLQLAVRAHPTERERLRRLPPGAVDASDGSLLDWAAHCMAAVGASTKAVFAPVLFGKPLVLIGGSVATGPRPSPAFVQRNRIDAITDADLRDGDRAARARAFLHEALFHRHVAFGAGPDALAGNRVLAPLLS